MDEFSPGVPPKPFRQTPKYARPTSARWRRLLMADAPILEVRGVSAAYEGGTVIHDIDFSVEKGSVTAILGANGAGKSTLLMAIVGMVTVTEGSVSFEGERIKPHATAKLSKRGLCLI